jgi:hypothetical protein
VIRQDDFRRMAEIRAPKSGSVRRITLSCAKFVLIAGKLVFNPLTMQLPIAQIATASHYATWFIRVQGG